MWGFSPPPPPVVSGIFAPRLSPFFAENFYGPVKTKEASPCDLSQSSSRKTVWQQKGNLSQGSICLSPLLFSPQKIPNHPLTPHRPEFSLSAAFLFIVIMNLCYPKSAAQLLCALMCVCVQSK